MSTNPRITFEAFAQRALERDFVSTAVSLPPVRIYVDVRDVFPQLEFEFGVVGTVEALEILQPVISPFVANQIVLAVERFGTLRANELAITGGFGCDF